MLDGNKINFCKKYYETVPLNMPEPYKLMIVSFLRNKKLQGKKITEKEINQIFNLCDMVDRRNRLHFRKLLKQCERWILSCGIDQALSLEDGERHLLVRELTVLATKVLIEDQITVREVLSETV